MYSRFGLLTVILVLIGIMFMSIVTVKAAVKSKVSHKTKAGTMKAWLDNENILTVYLSKAIPDKIKVYSDLFKVVDDDNNQIEVVKVSSLKVEEKKANLFELELKQPLEVDKLYFVKAKGYKDAPIIPRHVLDNEKYVYSGNDLGSVYSQNKTDFKIWAPTALNVEVLIYDYYSSDLKNTFTEKKLTKNVNGTWTASVNGDLKEKYYLYKIKLYVDGKETEYIVADPYSRASAVDCMKTLIFDPKDISDSVSGWENDTFVTLKQNVDAILYELHVRDYTISPTSGTEKELKGKYMGMAEHNTLSEEKLSTGVDNVIELGATHIHLLPTYDYGSGDEAEMNSSYTWYNWGYDPVLYNNVEGSYSTYPNGITRQIEYMKMVQAIHNSNLGVVFDAVFNHTFETGDKKFSIFDKIVPYYYYRVKDDGTYSNGSFCGNEFATERPMVRKFIVDSVKYFAEEYHIDGFRFDLMGLIDKETMLEIYRELKLINPNAIVYGEGWKMPTILPVEDCMIQANIGNSGVAAFNDGIRDNLRGDVFDAKAKGFVEGAKPMTGFDRLKLQIKGQSTGRNKKSIPVASPNATVNYVSCHDNLCLWDKLVAADPDASIEKIKKMDLLAFGAVVTSQGIPFLAEGDEFGRTKHGDDNSFNNNDPTINPINWNLKFKNSNMFKFYKGLIQLRKEHPAFRMTTEDMVNKHLEFLDIKLPDGVLAYVIKNNANQDSWRNILVILNSTDKDQEIEIVGKWKVVVLGEQPPKFPIAQAGYEMIRMDVNKINVPAISIYVAHTEDKVFSYELDK